VALSKKQKSFIEHYLQSWNATQAAKDAGYSDHSARSIGAENLTKPDIANEIQRRIDEISMSADEVLTEIAEIGRASIEDLMDVDEQGKLSFNFQRAKEEGKLHLIKSIVNTQWGIKVELHDRMQALQLIAKHLGLFTEKVDLTTGGKPLRNLNTRELTDEELETLEKILGRTTGKATEPDGNTGGESQA
jgi:phage terminase small subunit